MTFNNSEEQAEGFKEFLDFYTEMIILNDKLSIEMKESNPSKTIVLGLLEELKQVNKQMRSILESVE